MAEQDNYWDDARGLWIDGATGNYMKPVDRGGDGIWYSPDGKKKFVGGNWTDVVSSNASASTSAGFSPQAGSDYIMQGIMAARETNLENLQAQHNKELSALDNAARSELQNSINSLNADLQAKRITDEQYRQAKNLAQQETEFARSLAQRQLESRQSNEISQAQLEISKAAEMRQERALQANLAANPQDWVAYEFYKRALPKSSAGGGTAAAPGEGPGALSMLGGGEYEAAPGPTSDEDIQTIASTLFNPKGNTLYNPNIKGEGAFGANIEAPNTISRAEAKGLSAGEMAMIKGLLSAGVKVGDRRISIDPDDFFKQVGDSWIPTWNEIQQSTTYK